VKVNIKAFFSDERGVTLAAVLFVLVAVGSVGVALSALTQNMHETSASAVNVQKAYFASKSGFEWAIQKASLMGWTQADIEMLQGSQTLPNGVSFTLSYNRVSDTMTSSSTAGEATRILDFPNFSTFITPAPVP